MTRQNKKQLILQVAEKIMSQKGKRATISEIGVEAGVTDSVIYHYFANKEDLMFSVINERLAVALASLEEYLEAIEDPASKLRKFIWGQLKLHDDYPDYTSLQIFECRSNPNFRQHEAFKNIVKWADILKSILKEGVASGAFAPNLNIILARDAIFGLLDIENILSLETGLPEKSLADLDDILDLILAMLAPNQIPMKAEPGKAQIIMKAAECIFAAKGFEHATIVDIARKAGVSEGIIYEYYKNKEDLLFSAMRKKFEANLESMDEIFSLVTPIRKLRRLINYFFMQHLTQPLLLKILLTDGIFNRAFFSSVAYEVFQQYLSYFGVVLEEGKSNGTIREDINNRLYKNLVLGAFCHMSLRWQFLDPQQSRDKLPEIRCAVDLLTNFLKTTEN